MQRDRPGLGDIAKTLADHLVECLADTLVEKLAPHIGAEADRLLAEKLDGFAKYQEAGREVSFAAALQECF
jgi:hypothetical protein